MRINESMTFESIDCGWGNGEELGMKAVVVVDDASDCFLTSIDSLYTEGKVAMEMLSYKQKSGALDLWCSRAEYKDFVPWCTCIDYIYDSYYEFP